MFTAVSIFVGQGMLSGVVARSGDAQALRRVLAAEDRFAPIGGAMFVLGIVFGFVTAFVGHLDLTSARRSGPSSTSSTGAWLAIIFVMVVKPFS